MKLGIMNHPALKVVDEIKWAKENGFDFLDLTLEPPAAYIDKIDAKEIKSALAKYNLSAVGHTAYYFPIGSPIQAVRDASISEINRCLEVFKQIGVQKVNIHPDLNQPGFFSQEEKINFNIYSISKIVDSAKEKGITMMVENLNSCTHALNEYFMAIPDLKFHFDLGHSNLKPGECDFEKMLDKFSERLFHVHFSDNKGGYNDLHIPLGTGTVEWKEAITVLKEIGYDGTITLEVFSHDRDYLLLSKEKVKKYWFE